MKFILNNINIVFNDERFDNNTTKSIIIKSFEPISKNLFYIHDNIKNIVVISNTKLNRIFYIVEFIKDEDYEILEDIIDRIIKKNTINKVKLTEYDTKGIKFEYIMNIFEKSYFKS